MWRTRKFWEDTKERVLSSAVQGFVTGGVLQVGGEWVSTIDLATFPWQGAAFGAGGMGLLAFVKCLFAGTRGNPDSASFTKAVEPTT